MAEQSIRGGTGTKSSRQADVAIDLGFAPPVPDVEAVPRGRLFDRLDRSSAPVLALVAPAGYGKTTLLRGWLSRNDAPSAWLALADRHNDPSIIARDLYRAIGHPRSTVARLPVGQRAVAQLVDEMTGNPRVLVLDRVEVLRDRQAIRLLAELCTMVPDPTRLVFAGRTALPIHIPRLQMEGRLALLDAFDLSFDPAETAQLLARARTRIVDDDITALHERTEGWPAAVRLAATWLRHDRARDVSQLAGTTRPIADYLRSEVLDGSGRSDISFMVHTSMLDRLSGSLCDAVTDATGSSKVLDRLFASGVPIVPIDDRGDWFRYHRLLGDLLRSDLEELDADLAPAILARASAWCEAHGDPAGGIRYAEQVGDVDRVLRLTTQHARAFFQEGRGEVAESWFGWLRAHVRPGEFGEAAVLGGWTSALLGHPAEADTWLKEAERRALRESRLDDASSLEPSIALLRSLLCRRGVEEMREDADLALRGLEPTSPWRPVALLHLGVARLLEGDHEEADELLADAEEESERIGAVNALVATLSERSLLALRRGDRDTARDLLDRATRIRDDSGVGGYVSAALSYALAARLALTSADLPKARAALGKAAPLRSLLTYAVPWLSVQALLEMVHTRVALADAPGARILMREIDSIVRRRPRLGVLLEEIEDVRAQIDGIRVGAPGASALTSAELRVLPFLRTHLPFREIAEHLFVSKHTIKTQAISIYRKLGVTSRSEAVARAIDLGLLDPAADQI